tara:strand:+ start:755 stop:955 length:201 start_codon:yes stop_codon:yes gene_type:complete
MYGKSKGNKMSKVIHIFAAVGCFSLMILAIIEFINGNLMAAAVSLTYGFLVAVWASIKTWQLSRDD